MKASIPDSLLEEIQQLQDMYGMVTGQAIVLTDREGSMITRPTIAGRFYEEMIDSLGGPSRPFEQQLSRLGALTRPAALEEWIPGLKYIVSPLVPDYGQTYYLWSGLYMDQGAKEQVMSIFEARMKHHPEFGQLSAELGAMPEFTPERIADMREKLAVLGSITGKLLAGWLQKQQEEKSGTLGVRLLGNLEADYLDIETVLQLMAETETGDLYAFAEESGHGRFKVKYAAGKEAHLLLNAVFQQGEGFLGQAALGKEPRHWEAVAKDPRALFFTQLGLTLPEYLSCYPVRITTERRGLMLAAGPGSGSPEKDGGRQEQMIASLLGISRREELLLRGTQLGREGALRLKEAAALLPQAGSLQDLGAALLDIIMGLPFSPASALVHFQDEGQLADTYITRGWTPEDEAYYVRDLEARYSPQSFLTSAIVHESAGWGNLLECPLMAENEFKGIVSVRFRLREDAEHWMTLVETVAGLAGASISLIQKNSRYWKQSEVFLVRFREHLQNINEPLQVLSLDVSELAYDFARCEGVPEDEAVRVKRAGLLAPFRSDLMGEYGFFKKELLLLKQVDQLLAYHPAMERPVLPLPVQALALALQHVGGQADSAQLTGAPHRWIDSSRFSLDSAALAVIGDEQLSSFRAFLLSRKDSHPRKRAARGSRLLDSAALTHSKEEWGISPREEEVLELIVDGKTNKEIASALFISEHTVKNHLSRIFAKMNVTDRSQIIAHIYKQILNSERIEI